MGCLRLTYETEFCLSLAGDHKQTFGRRKKRAGTYKYKFGGNELQDELGLNVYDYDNRVYDQALGRFWQMDPKGELGRRWSSYNYCFDNPVYFQDPDGMWPWPTWSQVKSFASGVGTGVKNFIPSAVQHAKSEVRGLANAYKNIASNPKETLKFAAAHSGPALLYNMAKTQIETPASIVSNIANGNYQAAGETYGNHLATGATILATDGAIKGVSKVTGKTTVTTNAPAEAPVTNEIYSRPNNATTPAQRASVQGETCVDCGGTSEPMVADHKTPLVQEHYETGTINTEAMRSVDAVQPQCTTCSAKQGAEMSKYSKDMKKIIKSRTGE
jgi:RHS repeat-associated protein